MKISQKLILGIVFVIVLTTIAGYICIRINKKVLEKKIKAYSATQAEAILDAIDLKIYSRIEQVEIHAINLSKEAEMQEQHNAFKATRYIHNCVQQNDQQWQSDIQKGQINELMGKIYNCNLSRDLREEFELKEYYEDKYGHSIWGEVFVTNQYGVNIAQSRITSDYYQADEGWWIATKDNGLYIGDVEYDESAKIYSIAVCKRIDDETGNFLGVLKAVMNIREALDFLENAENKSPFKTLDLKLFTRKGYPLSTSGENCQKPSQIIQHHVSDFIENYSEDKHFSITTDDHNIEGENLYVFAYSKGYEGFAGLGWTLVVKYEADEVFASAIELRNYLLILLFVISIFSIAVAGLFVYRYVSVPIKKLIDAVRKIGSGDLNTQVTVSSNDEIGILSHAFNKMVSDLKEVTASKDELDREISTRKVMEKELRQGNRQLKEMQSQLVQSEKMASIGQLAAGIAHEINNPMGFVTSNFSTLRKYIAQITNMCQMYEVFIDSIQGHISLNWEQEIGKINLAKEELQINYILEDMPDLFDDSTEGMKRIIKIVKQLRDFSRIDQIEDFSYVSLAKNILSTLAIANTEMKDAVEIITDFDESSDVYCNSGQLNQVILNILVNAAQAIGEQNRDDKGIITIKIFDDNDNTICEIADDGPGIPSEVISKIFDPFFTTKPAGKGTGLGLNLSYDIVVNKHKGKLLVDSKLGKGTQFTIKIPKNLEKLLTLVESVEDGSGQDRLVCSS